jgi:hypothetical protein
MRIHELAKSGKIDELIKELVSGVHVDATDLWGWTPLIYACKNNNPSMVKVLLENGAFVKGTKWRITGDTKDEADIGALLVEYGAILNDSTIPHNPCLLKLFIESGRTVVDEKMMYDAIDCKSLDSVRLILSKGVLVHASAISIAVTTDLDIAMELIRADNKMPITSLAIRNLFIDQEDNPKAPLVLQALLEAGAPIPTNVGTRNRELNRVIREHRSRRKEE